MPLGISAITELGRFTKAYRRLDQRDQVAVDEVIGELLSGEDLPSGRWLKRVQSSSGVWEVRVNRGMRMTFGVKDGICVLRNVGEHDKILRKP